MTKLLSFAEVNPAACIQLATGREIMLGRLMQVQTYAGLLVGMPNPRVDDSIVEAGLKEASETFTQACKPYLIQPKKTPFTVQMQRRSVNKEGETKAAGEIEERNGERLPLVTCMGSFRCRQTLKSPDDEGFFAYSLATIVWFQETYAMPIAPAVLAEIRLLDWSGVAADVSD